MSEKSLDDFFAKKDKGKKGKKSKAKFTTSHEIAKNLTSGEEPRKIPKKTDKDKKNEDRQGEQKTEGDSTGAEIIQVEEWKEEEQKEVDYSDLKIQSLQVSEEPLRVDGEDGEEEEFDEYGELIKSKSQVPAGPWNVGTPTEGETPAEEAEQPPAQPEPAREELANVKGGVYVPPSKRNVPASANTQSSAQRRIRGKKKAPEISCQQEFPSLAASADILKYSNKGDERTFETVTKGVPKSGGPAARRPNLQLDNRYSALDRN